MSAHGWRRFHIAMMALWALLLVPSWFWWRESIFLVIFLSIYANWVGHFSSWQAARAEDKGA